MVAALSDSLTQLAFSMAENKGVYAVLLGSGASRAAEIPSGWEITLDLIRRMGVAQKVDEQTDWAAWYTKKLKKKPHYSEVLEAVAASPEERRSILHTYIEPTAEDRGAGRKVPTAAHEAIADLVRSGHVRVIITTNFDRLMENALRERGIEPTIVSSVDALRGAEPLTHTTCYLLKLHGDYKDARILNTDQELGAYPPEYDRLLDRIFDEHGLIVAGWSGEWDAALRGAILRAPNRRYQTYWLARGALSATAQQIVNHRKATMITAPDANTFFAELRARIETLEKTRRKNPRSIELLVNTTKRYLSKTEYRIPLDDLIAEETQRVVAGMDDSGFLTTMTWDQKDFRERVKKFEALTEALARMAGALCRWGTDADLDLVREMVVALHAKALKLNKGGLTVYCNLLTYPAALVFTSASLGLVRAQRWGALHEFFGFTVRENREPKRFVEEFALNAWDGTQENAWKRLDGFENRKTPYSDYTLALFAEWGKSFAGTLSDFEMLFNRYEILASLGFLERVSMDDLEAAATTQRQEMYSWMPIGRIAWAGDARSALVDELQSDAWKPALLTVGFARGSEQFLKRFIENLALTSRHFMF